MLDDPETRGTILVPLGILMLIYPLALAADRLGMPGGAVFGGTSALLGLYILFRGLGLERLVDRFAEKTRASLYSGRVTLITYVVAAALLVIGGVSGVNTLDSIQHQNGGHSLGALRVLAALIYGAVVWFSAAGITSSLGQITDEYLADDFKWRYLNAPFYVLAIGGVLYAVSAYFLSRASLEFLAGMLTAGTLLGLTSTLIFAIAESRYSRSGRARAS